MKLSVFFFISTILTFFVAATPLVVPRAASKPFKLIPRDFELFQIFPALQVQPIDGTKYYRFGWFNSNAFQSELYFPGGSDIPGDVLDTHRDGFEIVLNLFTLVPNSPAVYEVLLVNFANSEQTEFNPTRHFTISRNRFRYDTNNQANDHWFSCQINSGRVDLYFGHVPSAPGFCESVKTFDLYPSFEGLGRSFEIGVSLN